MSDCDNCGDAVDDDGGEFGGGALCPRCRRLNAVSPFLQETPMTPERLQTIGAAAETLKLCGYADESRRLMQIFVNHLGGER